jgi:hypothetical protein
VPRWAWLWIAWPLALALRAWAGGHAPAVERVYSARIYPAVASVLGRLAGLVPFSLAELLLAALLIAAGGWGVRRAVESVRRRRFPWRGLLRVAGMAGGGLGVAYAVFLVLWGLNYQREPAATRLALPVAPAAAAELAALAEALVLEANRLREGLPEDGSGALRLPAGLPAAIRAVRPDGPPPKAALSSVVLSYMGIAGIFVPFTGEPHVNATLPHCQVPFSTAHELAHRAGVAREDEANFEAWRMCRDHADPSVRYSGTFVASLYALGALRGVDPASDARLRGQRSAAVARDVRAIVAWRDRYESRLGDVQEKVNDAYLRAQGQAEGVRSYGRMVDLMLAERRVSTRRSPSP